MILVIESAATACSAALIDGERVLDERHEIVGRGHAERLVPMIAELLGEVRPTGILVDCGPGSFTGIRVGIAAAAGLGIGWQVPVHGFSATSLNAVCADADRFTVALTGGHGELFVQSFRRDPIEPTSDLQSLAPALAAQAAEARVFGSGAETLVSARGWGEASAGEPRAAHAAMLPVALRTLPPRPIYGRAPDAKPQS